MIKFELVALAGTKFGGEVHEVLLPTPDGQIAVFAHHAPLVSLAAPGIISVRRKANDPDDFMEHYATNGGVIEVMPDSVRVLVDEADKDEELNEKEVQNALLEARRLRAEAKDQVSLDKAQELIDRQSVRLKVAELRRRRRSR